MTVKFGHGTGTYLAVVSPTGMRELEEHGKNLQPDQSLWTSRQKRAALGLRLEDESEKTKYVRKNTQARRKMAKLGMRRLRAERAA